MLLAASATASCIVGAATVLLDVSWGGDRSIEQHAVRNALLVMVGGLALALLRRPSLARAARAADHFGGLDNRMATALEILDGRLHGELAPLQLAETWRACQTTAPRRMLPFLSPRLRTTISAGLLAATVAIVVAARADDLRGLVGRITPQQPAQPGATTALSIDPLASGVNATSVSAEAAARDATSAVTSARLRDLQTQDTRSRAVTGALGKLADALKGTAAAQDIGTSLERQDYATAGNQLKDLGRESDQLSTRAKQELARALLQAATNSANLDPALAQAEQEAVRGLGRGDYDAARKALDNLAQIVATQPQSIIPPADIARLQQQAQSQDPSAASNSGGCGGGDAYYAGPADCTTGALYSTGAMRTVTQSADIPSPAAGSGEIGRGSGYASGGGNASPLGDTVTRLDASGDNVVQVDLTLNGAQGRGGTPDPAASTTVISQGDQKDVVLNGAPQPSQPITDIAESTSVPPAQAQTVRSFFQPARTVR